MSGEAARDGRGGGDGRGISEISEIAGLFLEGVREAAGGGRVRPVRVPPGGMRVADSGMGGEGAREVGVEAAAGVVMGVVGGEKGQVDCAVEEPVEAAPSELDAARGEGETMMRVVGMGDEEECLGGRRVWAVMGWHVGRGVMGRAVAAAGKELAGSDGRAGVLERCGDNGVGGETVRLGLVDVGLPEDSAGAAEGVDAGEMASAVGELAGEVRGWVVGVNGIGGNEGVLEAAAGEGGAWLVPVEEGEEARVGAYRVIKAISSWGGGRQRGRLVLVAMGRGAVGVAGKLREVMRKFLAWDAADLIVVEQGADEAFVHRLVSAGGGEGTWGRVVGAMLGAGGEEACGEEVREEEVRAVEEEVVERVEEEVAEPVMQVVGVVREEEVREEVVVRDEVREERAEVAGGEEAEVVDLVGDGEAGVLESVMAGGEWVGCDLELPGRVTSRLVVDGEGRLVVLAVVGNGDRVNGVEEMAELGRAWRWVRENAGVVARAVRPVRAEGTLAPEVRVFVQGERAKDVAAMLEGAGEKVRVQRYRALRWGGRRGLLLEAA